MPDYGFTLRVEDLGSLKMKEFENNLASMGVKANVVTKEVSEHFEIMGERMTETFKNLKSLLLTGLGITALFEGWEFIEKSKEAFEGLEKAVTRVDTVLASTKFAAGFSSGEIQNQAKELSKVIVNKRDEILDAQGMLLSFHDIKGPKFTETMKSVADFATFYKEDMTQAALQVGKAINDPLKGMTRLQRMGVAFSAEQKEQIKNYIQQGELAKAQEVILKELRTEFGGQAQAFALTDAGKIQVAAKQWEELQFKIGEIISRVEVSLIPSFTKVVEVIKEIFNSTAIQFFIEHIKDLVKWALKLLPIWIGYKAVLAAVYGLTKAQAIAQTLLSAAMFETEAATEEATLAMEAFGAAIDTIGLVAFVATIGLAVEGFIAMAKHAGEVADKISNLAETKNKFHEDKENFEKIYNQIQIYDKISPSAQKQVASEAYPYIEKMRNDSIAAKPVLDSLNKAVSGIDSVIHKGLYVTKADGSKYYPDEADQLRQRNAFMERISTNEAITSANSKNTSELIKALKNKNVPQPKYLDPNSGLKDSSINTSQLSGASGGLGQAKIIHIHVGVLQQNNGVKESKAESEKAIEKLTEMLSGFSDSQNSQ